MGRLAQNLQVFELIPERVAGIQFVVRPVDNGAGSVPLNILVGDDNHNAGGHGWRSRGAHVLYKVAHLGFKGFAWWAQLSALLITLRNVDSRTSLESSSSH